MVVVLVSITFFYTSHSCKFFTQGLSNKLTELEQELFQVTTDLEKEKATTIAQTEEIEILKKVHCNVLVALITTFKYMIVLS